VLSNVDRELLQRCLSRSSGGWDDFVDRFLGLVQHVVDHTAATRSIPLAISTREDLVSDVFVCLLKDDFAVLRRFRGRSSLATYLTVIARRIVVRGLIQRRISGNRERTGMIQAVEAEPTADALEQLAENRDSIEMALNKLSQEEAMAVRMYHLEGKTYREIGLRMGMAENSIGPYLTRARAKMREMLSS
jgi:RNA polymerase sigma-70 factor (ECF subfamily)